MKQTYLVHYKGQLTEDKPSDLISIEVDEVGVCPCCGIATSPTFLDGFITVHPDIKYNLYSYIILYCTNCKSIYAARYISNRNINNLCLESVFPKTARGISFSENINKLSPKVVSLYNQANEAETRNEIKGLAGIGHRKALEFLIKDYLIKFYHQDTETIKKMELGNCVNKLPEKIQSIAKASIWIGNDETHYFRKNPEYDIEDLRKFIDCFIHFIEMDYAINEANKLTQK